MQERNIIDLIEQITQSYFHPGGMVSKRALKAIIKNCGMNILSSAETGSGLTTLLFSHISQNHKVFAVDDGQSISSVRSSSLFKVANVEFIEKPTQLSLPRYEFKDKFDAVLIDGPHGYPFPDMEYYYFYPHIKEGGILIIDDINIPTIHNLFRFLKDEDMFEFIELEGYTAFFKRTAAPLFDPYGDGWVLQKYNKKRVPRIDLPVIKTGIKVIRDEGWQTFFRKAYHSIRNINAIKRLN